MARKLKKVHGVGINDADFPINPTVGGKQRMNKAYQVWKAMLCRCYSDYGKTVSPSYTGCEVADAWKTFSSFKKWFDCNYVQGWEIDKDILGDGKLYSESTCIFVPSWVNCFVLGRDSARGEHPIGVHKSKECRSYVAMCSHPISKKRVYLGSFVSPELAAYAWLKRKLEVALELKSEMDCIDARIYPGVIRMVNEAYSGGNLHAALSKKKKIECLTPEIAAEAVSLARSGHVVGTAAIVLVGNAGQLGRLQGMVAGWIGDLTEEEQGAY